MRMRGVIMKASKFSRQFHVLSKSKTIFIKPSSPTPLNLKQYTLPLYDRVLPSFHIPVVLFYPNNNSDQTADSTGISNRLKKSLADTLSKYHPFAGRLRSSGFYVACNDEGVHFVEARIGCKLSQILEKASVKGEEGLDDMFPPGSIWGRLRNQDSSLMVVQLNHFSCGGVALSATLSHRLGDASTLCSFLRYWAAVSRGDHQKLSHICPLFVYEQSPESYNDDSTVDTILYPEKHWMTKEIVLDNTKIAKLKAAVQRQDQLEGVIEDQNYTRNELVTALLYRCAVAAAATSNAGEYTASVLCQAINMRPMMDPPLEETVVGNFITVNHIPTSIESETKLNRIIGRMKKGKIQLKGIRSLDGYGPIQIMTKYTQSKHRVYAISSLCNFPVYETDFGWGRPSKASLVDTPFVNFITLTDTPSRDGIKATVSLEEQDMENLQENKELLTYACF